MKKTLDSAMKFGVPFLLWIFLFKPFLWGKAVISSEAFYIYSLVKYFWDNLRIGVFPLWNPFILCGQSEQILMFNYIGAFNPVWLWTGLLNFLGVSPYFAYLWTIIPYYFIGQIGFYLLAKTLIRNEMAAYLAFLLFLFSSFSLFILQQYHPPLFYVPCVWFFYFLCAFFRLRRIKYFVGMTFSLMLIFSVYFPLYFVTVFLLCGILSAGIDPRRFRDFIRGLGEFCCRHKVLIIVCAAVFLVSLLEGFQSYRSAETQEVIGSMRTFKAGAAFPNYSQTTDGAMSARMTVEDLYSNLDHIEYLSDGFFFVPVFAYLVLFLSIFNQVNRKIVFLGLLSCVLLLLNLANVTPVHEFLYRHVFYFKLMRNLHFFLTFLLSAFILLVAEQFRCLIEKLERPGNLSKTFFLGFAVVVHASLVAFLLTRENVIAASFMAIALSLIFWVFMILSHKPPDKKFILVMLWLVILVQPVEVFWKKNIAAEHFEDFIKQCVHFPAAVPKFSYIRASISPEELSQHPYSSRSRLAMIDSPGFVAFQNGFTPYWTYFASEKIPLALFDAYTHHKLWLYDRVEMVGEDPESLLRVKEAWTDQRNTAFFAGVGAGKDLADLSLLLSNRPDIPPTATSIEGPTDQFAVVGFSVNSLNLMTNFGQEKFLVYTDSYFKGWKAFLNGKEVPLYRANIAFKGVRLPAGRNELKLIYDSGVYVHVLIWAVFVGVFIWLLLLFHRDRGKEGAAI